VAARVEDYIDVFIVADLAEILVSSLWCTLLLQGVRSLRSRIPHALLKRREFALSHVVLSSRHIPASCLCMHSSPCSCYSASILLR
jgi:hypothetical protein